MSMTLPRSKSRAITVDGTPYRWMVSRVDQDFSLRLRIEHAEGQGQALVVKLREVYGTNRVPPVTPRYVAAAIRHGRMLGWRPEEPGRELAIDASQLGRLRSPLAEEPLASGTTALWSRVDFDPLRVGFPWAHHDPGLFVDFRISAEPSEKALGSFFAYLAHGRKISPGSGPAAILAALCRPEADPELEAEGQHPFSISGGIEVIIDGRRVLRHGCCVTVDEWVQWRELLSSGQRPWNGHDPFSSAELEGDGVRLIDAEVDPPPSITRERYEEMVVGLDEDLRGFLRAAGAWVAERASVGVAEVLSERIAVSMGVERRG